MRELTMQIHKCEDCPFYQYNYDVRADLCYYRKNSPFAVIRTGTNVDKRCELKEIPDPVREVDTVDYTVFQQSGLVANMESLPPEWLEDLTPEERERINRDEDARIEQMLAEEGMITTRRRDN